METINLVIASILELPWIVKGPGLGLMGILALRALIQFLTFHPIRGATSIVYAVIIALVLYNYGARIAEYLTDKL